MTTLEDQIKNLCEYIVDDKKAEFNNLVEDIIAEHGVDALNEEIYDIRIPGFKYTVDGSPLLIAILAQKNAYIDQLIKKGVDTEKTLSKSSWEHYGLSALGASLYPFISNTDEYVKKGALKIFKELLDHPAFRKSQNNLIITFMYAAFINDEKIKSDVFNLLLEYGVSITKKIGDGDTRTSLLDFYSMEELIEYLPIFHRSKPEQVKSFIIENNETIALNTILSGQSHKLLPFLLSNGLNTRFQLKKEKGSSSEGSTLLSIAILLGDEKAVDILLSDSVSNEDKAFLLRTPDKNGLTPIDKAVLIEPQTAKIQNITKKLSLHHSRLRLESPSITLLIVDEVNELKKTVARQGKELEELKKYKNEDEKEKEHFRNNFKEQAARNAKKDKKDAEQDTQIAENRRRIDKIDKLVKKELDMITSLQQSQSGLSTDLSKLIDKVKIPDNKKKEAKRIMQDPRLKSYYLAVLKTVTVFVNSSVEAKAKRHWEADLAVGIIKRFGTKIPIIGSFLGIAGDLGEYFHEKDIKKRGETLQNYILQMYEYNANEFAVELALALTLAKEKEIKRPITNIDDFETLKGEMKSTAKKVLEQLTKTTDNSKLFKDLKKALEKEGIDFSSPVNALETVDTLISNLDQNPYELLGIKDAKKVIKKMSEQAFAEPQQSPSLVEEYVAHVMPKQKTPRTPKGGQPKIAPTPPSTPRDHYIKEAVKSANERLQFKGSKGKIKELSYNKDEGRISVKYQTHKEDKRNDCVTALNMANDGCAKSETKKRPLWWDYHTVTGSFPAENINIFMEKAPAKKDAPAYKKLNPQTPRAAKPESPRTAGKDNAEPSTSAKGAAVPTSPRGVPKPPIQRKSRDDQEEEPSTLVKGVVTGRKGKEPKRI